MSRRIKALCYGLITLTLAMVLSYPLLAVTFNNVPTLPLAPRLWMVSITNANGTTLQNVATCGTNAGQVSKIQSIVVTNGDPAVAYTLLFWMVRSNGPQLIADVSVTAAAGSSTSVTPINVLGPSSTLIPGLPTDAYGPYLLCQLNDALEVDVTAAVTSTRDVNVLAQGGDF